MLVVRLSPGGPMLRVHSENDTAVHTRVPHSYNNGVAEQQVIEKVPAGEVNSNHNQFSLGSTELLNGRSVKSDTLADTKKSSKVGFVD